jgi:hypothetical protein
MSDRILQVKITRELVQDLYAFHGLNAFTELRLVAEEQVKLNNDKWYEFVVGSKVLDQWVPERTLSSEELKELEESLNEIKTATDNLADANLQFADKLNKLFKPVRLAEMIKAKKEEG